MKLGEYVYIKGKQMLFEITGFNDKNIIVTGVNMPIITMVTKDKLIFTGKRNKQHFELI